MLHAIQHAHLHTAAQVQETAAQCCRLRLVLLAHWREPAATTQGRLDHLLPCSTAHIKLLLLLLLLAWLPQHERQLLRPQQLLLMLLPLLS